MPPETFWNKFFNTDDLLDSMQINSAINHLVDVGSGYGTFTIPSAYLISGNLYAFDIEQEMIDDLTKRLEEEHFDLKNVTLYK